MMTDEWSSVQNMAGKNIFYIGEIQKKCLDFYIFYIRNSFFVLGVCGALCTVYVVQVQS